MMARGGEIGFAARWPADVAVERRPVPDRDAIAARHAAPAVPLVDTPGGFVVTAEQLADWAIEAEEGARCVYARVASMAHHSRLRDKAQALARLGILQLGSARHDAGDHLFDQVARRMSAPWSEEAPPPPPSDDVLTAEARRLLDMLARLADQGAPCPQNRGLARAVGLHDADAAAYQLRRLAERGFILRRAVPVAPGRVITIVETGAKTGLIGR